MAIGSFLLGIVGALFAVPVLAVANTVVRYFAGQEPMPPAELDVVHESSQENSGPTDG